VAIGLQSIFCLVALGLASAPALAGAVVIAHVGAGTITSTNLDVAIGGLPQEERLMVSTSGPLRELVEALIDQRLLADAARRAGLDRDVAQDAALADAWLGRRLAASRAVDEATLRAYYDAHRGEFSIPCRARVERLVYADEGPARAALGAARGGAGFAERSAASTPCGCRSRRARARSMRPSSG
jgi:hypothetical protein